jgi:chemotaxis protein histidine kinase CheA
MDNRADLLQAGRAQLAAFRERTRVPQPIVRRPSHREQAEAAQGEMLGDLLPAAVAVAVTATAATPSIELSNGCGASDAWQELHSASCQSAQLSGTLGRTVEKLLLHAGGCGDGPQAAALAPLRQQVKRQLAEKASLEQRLEAAARALRGQRAALAVAPAVGAGPGGPGSNGAAEDEACALRATNKKLEMKLDLYKQQLAARGRSPSEAAAPTPPPAPSAPAAAAAAEAEAARLREALALVRDELAAASAAAAVAAESATSKQRQLSQELSELKKQQPPSQDPPQAPLPSSQAQDAAAAAAAAAAVAAGAALASLQQEADAARARAEEAEARLRVQEAAHQAERSQVRGANEQQPPPLTPVDAATTGGAAPVGTQDEMHLSVAPLTSQSAAPAADVTGAATAVSGGGDVGVSGGVGGGDGGAGGGGGGSVGSSGGSPIRATRPGEVTTLRQLGTLDKLEALTDRLLRTLFGGIFGQSPIFGLLGAEVCGGDEEGDLESGGAACVGPARDAATAAHLPAEGRAGDSSAAARDLDTGAATVPSVPPATVPLPLPPAAAVGHSAATAAVTGPPLAPTAAMTDAAVLPVADFMPPAAAIAMASDEEEVAPPPLLSADVPENGARASDSAIAAEAEAAPEAQKKPLLEV